MDENVFTFSRNTIVSVSEELLYDNPVMYFVHVLECDRDKVFVESALLAMKRNGGVSWQF